MNAKRLFVLLLPAALSACMTSPQAVMSSPRQYLTANQPSRVWLSMRDGSQVIVEGPRVIDDTVFGWSEGGTEDLMIPVTSIRQVKVRKMAVVRTALIPATFLVGAVAAYTMISTDGTTAPPQQSQCLEEMEDECAAM